MTQLEIDKKYKDENSKINSPEDNSGKEAIPITDLFQLLELQETRDKTLGIIDSGIHWR